MQRISTRFPWLVAVTALIIGVAGLVVRIERPPSDPVATRPRAVIDPGPDDRCSPHVPRPDPDPLRAASFAVQGAILVARIPVLVSDGTTRGEAVVRTNDGGWCVLVPAGPALTFAVHGEWVWLVRAERAGNAAWLGRVPITGGRIQRVAVIDRVPQQLAIVDDRVIADGEVVNTIDDLLLADHAPARAVNLPSLPLMSNHPPEVKYGSPEILKLPANEDPSQDMIVRATRGGWCVLVPAGPRLQMLPARGWVWFARRESTAATARVGLYRVSAGGGPISRVAWVPVMPAHLRFRNAAVWGDDDAHPRNELWAEWATEDRPSEPPTCPGLGASRPAPSAIEASGARWR